MPPSSPGFSQQPEAAVNLGPQLGNHAVDPIFPTLLVAFHGLAQLVNGLTEKVG